MVTERARDVIVAQCPAVTAKHQIGALRASGADDFSEAHHFERHFLLGRATRLLPLQ